MVSDKERNIVLPDKYLQEFAFYIEQEPQPDYVHAPVEAHEAFRDMKFGVRIHWGIYSIWELRGESWPFLTMDKQKRQQYQELYKTWNPKGFDAEKWMQFFDRAGFKCFAFTTKHHEGFCMYDTNTRVKKRINWTARDEPFIDDCDLAYSIMETPFKRDVVKELCDAARKHDIKVDLYFSHPDWYDADFRPYSHHPILTEEAVDNARDFDADLLSAFTGHYCEFMPPASAEESARMMQRHRDQLVEVIGKFKPDMCCLDMRLGPRNWPHVRETTKILRKLHPPVMFRNRGIGNYGDYYTPEGFVPGDPANTNMPWMVIYPLGSSFSYEGDTEKHKGTRWIVHNLVDVCAKGGNFMVGIGPSKDGTFHPEAVKQLEAAGGWVKVNAEGIYGTRPWKKAWKEGNNVRFTASKDGKTLYAFVLEWPGKQIVSTFVKPVKGSKVFMLGSEKDLEWKVDAGSLKVAIPDDLAQHKPCDHAWCIKIEPKL
jgi:alpha-L-fucosidase